ncbi:hypothetical protein QBC40DRAFT_270825 [Triangularia verruculosa]|uniref:Uncharacterized protein n=1 Tax=Triangularia verruculosa TaxID=2587418 RepID=A0AAN7B0W5_9PEZI|nr:hypothetical protein QBC40DRAFT_270825 [Triangularia verruculosa]
MPLRPQLFHLARRTYRTFLPSSPTTTTTLTQLIPHHNRQRHHHHQTRRTMASVPDPSTSPTPGPSPSQPSTLPAAPASTSAAVRSAAHVEQDAATAPSSTTTTTNDMSTTAATQDSSSGDGAIPKPLPPALPAPGTETESPQDKTTTVVVNGAPISLDALGPMVVNRDGTLARIANWQEMSSFERENTLRILGKRNQLRLATLRGDDNAEKKD